MPLSVSQNYVLRHEADSCARASCQKAPLFDTRESIGEKSVAHVPGFFGFLLKSGFARKSDRLLQQSEGHTVKKRYALVAKNG